MDITLATVTIISLLLAWAMVIVTWQRVRAERRRSDARLAALMAEVAEDPARGIGPMEPPEGHRAPAAPAPAISPRPRRMSGGRGVLEGGLGEVVSYSPVLPQVDPRVPVEDTTFERRGAARRFAGGLRDPATTKADAPPRRRWRAFPAPRLPFAAPDPERRVGDAGTGEHPPRRARGGEVPRGLATRARSYLRGAVLAPTPPPSEHWGHRAAAVAVATVLVAGVSLAERIPLPRGGAALPVELLSLDHRREGDYLAVSGSLRNPPRGRERSKLSITATVFDGTGAIVGTGQTPLPAAALPPGGETAFTISLPNAGRINRYRVSFMEDRSPLPHLDRRGPDAGTAAAGTRP